MRCSLVLVYRGHENRLFASGPNWVQFTFPPTRKCRRVSLIVTSEEKTKKRAMADMILIASMNGSNTLLGYREAESMYNAVVYHRRWYRRIARFLGFKIA